MKAFVLCMVRKGQVGASELIEAIRLLAKG